MNAVPPSPEQAGARTARHLAMLAELAEIGMALARALGEQALRALEPLDPAAPADAPPGRGDPALAFTRIARAVRQTIALEARLLAGEEAAAPRRRAARTAPDPRRAVIRRVLRRAAEADGAGNREREVDERLDNGLDDDLDASVEEIIAAIRDDLGIGLDLSRQPDEVLAMLSRSDLRAKPAPAATPQAIPPESVPPQATPPQATPPQSAPSQSAPSQSAPSQAAAPPPTPPSRPGGPDPP